MRADCLEKCLADNDLRSPSSNPAFVVRIQGFKLGVSQILMCVNIPTELA